MSPCRVTLTAAGVSPLTPNHTALLTLLHSNIDKRHTYCVGCIKVSQTVKKEYLYFENQRTKVAQLSDILAATHLTARRSLTSDDLSVKNPVTTTVKLARLKVKTCSQSQR